MLSTLSVDLKGKEGLCEAASVSYRQCETCLHPGEPNGTQTLPGHTEPTGMSHMREKKSITWDRVGEKMANRQTIMCEEAYHPHKVWQKISATGIRKCSCNILVY